jgi:hypothetical protein
VVAGGDWIVFIGTEEGLSGLWLIHPDGSDLHQAARGWYSCWSSDGRGGSITLRSKRAPDISREYQSTAGNLKSCDQAARPERP